MFANFRDVVNDMLSFYGDGEAPTPPMQYRVVYALSVAGEPASFYFSTEARSKRQADYWRTHDHPAVCRVERYQFSASRWQVLNERTGEWE